MRCIGIVGGMSWESTAHYYRALNQGVKARLGGLHSARLVLQSVEFAEIEAMQREGRWEDAGRVLRDAVRGLEGAGAEFVLLAANTMHKVADQMMAGARIPLLHIADVTGEAARRAGLGTVGLLATRYVMEEDFYVRRLEERHGLEVLVPGPEDRAEVHRVIFEELVLGTVNPASKARFLAIAAGLQGAGAQGLVAGCTEIGMLLRPGDLAMPLLDTLALHVEAALDLALAPRAVQAGGTMKKALQDLVPDNHCWGCGPDNPRGLQLKSYLEGEETVCRFQPLPEHMAGPTHVVYGGIIAAVIDCHTVFTAIADAYRVAGREVGSGPPIWAVTASLKVDYLAPASIKEPMELRARVREAKGRKRVVECTLRSGGRECARAEVVVVEVPATWTRPPG